MKRNDFERFIADMYTDAEEVMLTKGRDYAREDNAFHNYETVADFTGQTREQVLGGHMYKHVSALYRYIRDGELDSEGLRGRAIDLINYAATLVAMAEAGAPRKWFQPEMLDLSAGRDVPDTRLYTINVKEQDGRLIYGEPQSVPAAEHMFIPPFLPPRDTREDR